MIEATIFKMATRNLLRNKARNLATATVIACGFAGFVCLGGYRNRNEILIKNLVVYSGCVGHIAIFKKDGARNYSIDPAKFSFTPAEQNIIDEVLSSITSIDYFGAKLMGNGLVSNGCDSFPFTAIGYDPIIEKKSMEFQETRALVDEFKIFDPQQGRWNYPPELGAIMVSEGLVKLLGKPKTFEHVPKPLSSESRNLNCNADNVTDAIADDANVQLLGRTWDNMTSAVDAEIVNHFKTGLNETNSRTIVTSLPLLQKLFDTPNVTAYMVFLKTKYQLFTARERYVIAHKLKRRGFDVDVYKWIDEAASPFYASTMSMFYIIVGFAEWVLVLIVSLSIFNTATMTIVERSKEIGMMRSLGYTRGAIRKIFVLESAVLTAGGLLLGSLLALIAFLTLEYVDIPFRAPGVTIPLTFRLKLDGYSVVLATILIVGSVIGTNLFAVWDTSRRNIAKLVIHVQR